MKNYTRPELNELTLRVEDVIQISGDLFEGANTGDVNFGDLKNAMNDGTVSLID